MMDILKGNKNHNSNKFIIKPKQSATHLRSQQNQPQSVVSCSEQEIDLFISHMIQKSKKFKTLLQQKQVQNEQQFFEKHLFRSLCLKTIIKTAIDKMLSQRRLGKNLKGMNKFNMAEIQNYSWSSIIREIDLYNNQKSFFRQKEQLQATLAKRKEEILQQLQKLHSKAKPRLSTSPNQTASQ